MESLPSSHLDFPSANGHSYHQEISKDNLLTLFKSQQDLLNHFFKHLDLSQILSFSCLLLSTSGTVFFTGFGKSAFVANKISQTRSFCSSFLSPLHALHGDLPSERELCPFNLAPVTSTAIQLVFGDTIAFALMAARNLTKEEYGDNHPAGRIGKSLIFKDKDVMKKKDEIPVCKEGDLIMDQLVELTSKGCWCLLVVDEGHPLIGTFTDGDLHRTLKATPSYPEKLTFFLSHRNLHLRQRQL